MNWKWLIAACAACVVAAGATRAEEATKPVAAEKPADAVKMMDPVLTKVGEMVGGTWTGRLHTQQGDIPVEFRFQWTGDHKGVEGFGTVGKGTPFESRPHSIMGWDPAAKKVYYCDFHGSQTAFFGYVTQEKDEIVFRFHALVGAPGEWESRTSMPDHNTYRSSLSVKGGPNTAPLFHMEIKRQPAS